MESNGAYSLDIEIDEEICIQCRACTDECPMQALSVMSVGFAYIVHYDDKKCSACGMCVDVCPTGALTYA